MDNDLVDKDMARLLELTQKCMDGWKNNQLPPYLTESEVKELESINFRNVERFNED